MFSFIISKYFIRVGYNTTSAIFQVVPMLIFASWYGMTTHFEVAIELHSGHRYAGFQAFKMPHSERIKNRKKANLNNNKTSWIVCGVIQAVAKPMYARGSFKSVTVVLLHPCNWIPDFWGKYFIQDHPASKSDVFTQRQVLQYQSR